jgi:hypothetical protein
MTYDILHMAYIFVLLCLLPVPVEVSVHGVEALQRLPRGKHLVSVGEVAEDAVEQLPHDGLHHLCRYAGMGVWDGDAGMRGWV